MQGKEERLERERPGRTGHGLGEDTQPEQTGERGSGGEEEQRRAEPAAAGVAQMSQADNRAHPVGGQVGDDDEQPVRRGGRGRTVLSHAVRTVRQARDVEGDHGRHDGARHSAQPTPQRPVAGDGTGELQEDDRRDDPAHIAHQVHTVALPAPPVDEAPRLFEVRGVGHRRRQDDQPEGPPALRYDGVGQPAAGWRPTCTTCPGPVIGLRQGPRRSARSIQSQCRLQLPHRPFGLWPPGPSKRSADRRLREQRRAGRAVPACTPRTNGRRCAAGPGGHRLFVPARSPTGTRAPAGCVRPAPADGERAGHVRAASGRATPGERCPCNSAAPVPAAQWREGRGGSWVRPGSAGSPAGAGAGPDPHLGQRLRRLLQRLLGGAHACSPGEITTQRLPGPAIAFLRKVANGSGGVHRACLRLFLAGQEPQQSAGLN